ncbi:MAG: hypothetical protein NVS4B8_20970 [Herpetosiphon sp.]
MAPVFSGVPVAAAVARVGSATLVRGVTVGTLVATPVGVSAAGTWATGWAHAASSRQTPNEQALRAIVRRRKPVNDGPLNHLQRSPFTGQH